MMVPAEPAELGALVVLVIAVRRLAQAGPEAREESLAIPMAGRAVRQERREPAARGGIGAKGGDVGGDTGGGNGGAGGKGGGGGGGGGGLMCSASEPFVVYAAPGCGASAKPVCYNGHGGACGGTVCGCDGQYRATGCTLSDVPYAYYDNGHVPFPTGACDPNAAGGAGGRGGVGGHGNAGGSTPL